LGNTLIVAFAFGIPETTLANALIASIASTCARTEHASIYTQSTEYLSFPDPAINVERITEEPGKPAPTLRIARAAVAWAKENRIRFIWIACARPHLWRCRRDLTQAIKEAGVHIQLRVCPLVLRSKSIVWFSPKSTQARTQNAFNWFSREVIVWLMPFWLYNKIAS
jgi:hypothetical protein